MKCALAALLFLAPVAAAQPALPPDVQAERQLETGRKALAAKDYTTARGLFDGVVSKFGNTPAASPARYGLALAKLQGGDGKLTDIADLLDRAAADAGFADRGAAALLRGQVERAIALNDPAKVDNGRLDRAKDGFRLALDHANYHKKYADAADARCQLAEVELRQNRPQEARQVTEPFLKAPEYQKLDARGLGLYYHGLALFTLKDYPNAAKTLNRAGPFDAAPFGPHAEYLLGRLAHLSGERGEAAVHYEAAIALDEKQRKAAQAALDGGKLGDQPLEKARLGAVAKARAEFAGAARFHLAALDLDAGRAAKALAAFERFEADSPTSPLVPDARLRAAACQVQLSQPDEAIRKLTPLAENPRLADQALGWLAQAHLARATPADPKPLKLAQDAAEKALQRVKSDDPPGRRRRAELQLTLADIFQLQGEFSRAAEATQQVLGDNQLPEKREEVLARLANLWGLAKDAEKARRAAEEFRKAYPQSPLTPAVALREAELALGRALDGDRAKLIPEALAPRYSDAAGRFREVAEKYPDSPQANAALLGLAQCLMQTGAYAEAAKAVEGIPGPERAGDLAVANFVLGDALLRLATSGTEGKHFDGPQRDKLTASATALEAYLKAGKPPEAPAALVKLAHARRRLGQISGEKERNRLFDSAREALDEVARDSADKPEADLALVERAKINSARGDRGQAMNDLRAFGPDGPRAGSPHAYLAALSLSAMLREDGQPAEAAKLLGAAADRLKKLPNRSEAPVMEKLYLVQYHQALASLEAGQFDRAAELAEPITWQAGLSPLAPESALVTERAKLAKQRKRLADALKLKEGAGADAEKARRAEQEVAEARKELRAEAQRAALRSEELRPVHPDHEARAWLLWEAATASREGRPADAKEAPAQALASYKHLIEQFPNSRAGVQGRLDLADLTEPADAAGAVALLKEALEVEPRDGGVPPELAERLHFRLGLALANRKDFAGAAKEFQRAGLNEKSPLRAESLLRAGEAYLGADDPRQAAQVLTPFIAKPELRDPANICDRALLRLAQAELALQHPEPARKAVEQLRGRIGENHPLAFDARYTLGQVAQAQGKLAEAIACFEAVSAGTVRELSLRAQLQLGLCHLAQKRYPEALAAFGGVNYNAAEFPELRGAARLEAARTLELSGKPAETKAALEKIVSDGPAESAWVKAAKGRLAGK